MKLCLSLLLAACVVPVAVAQTNGPAQPPAPMPPQDVQMRYDGKCPDAKPGDTVNFTLTIEAVENAKAVYGELQLRNGRGSSSTVGLPLPDFRHMAGGGLGTRDAQSPNMYHFAFKVPTGLISGVYRGVGVVVTVDKPVASMSDASRDVDVTRHTRDEVKKYCLNVMSGYPEGRPEVTAFEPGSVVPPAAAATSTPAPR